MKTLHVYINYNGNCAEAFAHYAKVLKSELSESLTYADTPPNTGMPQVAEEFHNRIMHCTLPLNENVTLMGSDAAGDACARFVQDLCKEIIMLFRYMSKTEKKPTVFLMVSQKVELS